MWISFIVAMLAIFIYYAYGTYFKEYIEVAKIFDTLGKVLDARDLQLLKLTGENLDKKEIAKMVMLIDKRKEVQKSGYTIKMNVDVELSNFLKTFYQKLANVLDNDVSKSIFKSLMELEAKAKKIRIKYNIAVERYNNNLILHKKVCMKLIRMKPLDEYKL